MKKINLFLVGLFSTVCCYGQINYSISGEVPTAFPALKMMVVKGAQSSPFTIENDKFSYMGAIEKPQMITLVVDYEGSGQINQLSLFASGGDILLKLGENKTFDISGNQDAMDCLYKVFMPVMQWNTKIAELDDKLSLAEKNKTADTATLKAEYIQAVDACFKAPQDFIKANPSSMVSIMALYYLDKGKDVGQKITLNDLEQLYTGLADTAKNSAYGKQYAADLAKWKKEAK